MDAVVEASKVVARGLDGEKATDQHDGRSARDTSLENRLDYRVGQLHRLLGQHTDLGNTGQEKAVKDGITARCNAHRWPL